MELVSVDVVFYWVADLDAVFPFYSDTLGLKARPRHGEWQEFEIGGTARFALHGGATPSSRPSATVAFEVASLDLAIAELAAKGHAPLDDITDTGAARFVTYADPEGNPVQLLERD